MGLGNRHSSPTRPITPDASHHRHLPFKQMLMQRIHSIFGRDDPRCRTPDLYDETYEWPAIVDDLQKCPPLTKDQRPLTGPPRQLTFKRQNSERRERLCPVAIPQQERRAVSASRHVSTSCMRRRRTRSSPPPSSVARSSAPVIPTSIEPQTPTPLPILEFPPEEQDDRPTHNDNVFDYEERYDERYSRSVSRASSAHWFDEEQQRELLQHELDTKWILNLSMHFRDKSDREKFFVTYAQTPKKWRRVTVSCDYRTAEPGSLEMDLKELRSQRDKSLSIYEAIRESLVDIQFYNTVTNLKLETCDGRLHVHVTEDLNEIIPYPARSMVRHVLDDLNLAARPLEICESELAFDGHLSGFVYRVWHNDKIYIKKEIPSPDTIDEFLYEVNALHALYDSKHVVDLKAIILDDTKQVVKGLLIDYAEQGALVDLLYDNKGKIPWAHREKWARQAVMGLRDIHEEGYVQGDFTLSNIVVDEKNNAKIIDINRRGCPVGWEPPELAQKIASNQRISMYIGEKSDIFQLGMSLWALAMDDDEPERHDPPLSTASCPGEVPGWFQEIMGIALAEKPRDRISAKELAKLFPAENDEQAWVPETSQISPRLHPLSRPEPKQYIDPDDAVELADIERFRQKGESLYSPESSKADWKAFTYPASSQYQIGSSTSNFERPRGRPRSVDECEHRTSTEPAANDSQAYEMPPNTNFASTRPVSHSEALDITGVVHLSFPLDSPRPMESTCMRPSFAGLRFSSSSSIFTVPDFRRSRSETTPRTSRIRLPSETRSLTPHISPRSTLLDLPDRPRSAETFISPRRSTETISACNGSVGETSFSGTTCFTQHSSSTVASQDDSGSGTIPHSFDDEQPFNKTRIDFLHPSTYEALPSRSSSPQLNMTQISKSTNNRFEAMTSSIQAASTTT